MIQFLDLEKKIEAKYHEMCEKKNISKKFTPNDKTHKDIVMYLKSCKIINNNNIPVNIFKKLKNKKTKDITFIQTDYISGIEIRDKKGRLKKYRIIPQNCYIRCKATIDLVNGLSDKNYFKNRFVFGMSYALLESGEYDIIEDNSLVNSELCMYYMMRTVEALQNIEA